MVKVSGLVRPDVNGVHDDASQHCGLIDDADLGIAELLSVPRVAAAAVGVEIGLKVEPVAFCERSK